MVWQLLGGLSGATSVAAGAYGAHGLSKRLQALEAEGRNPFAPPRASPAAAAATAPSGGSRGLVSLWRGGGGREGAATTPAAAPPQEASSSSAPTVTAQEVWSRAVAYQQLHSVGLLLVPLLTPPASAARTAAGGLFASGICLFSGGLYGTVLTGDKRISQGAPFGGIAFILGWLALAVSKRPIMIP